MRMADAKEIVASAHIDPTLYSFDSETHESLCLLAFGQEWRVFISERGQRSEERTFTSEDDACTYFMKRIFQLAR
jgi:hypothetical protein